MSIDKALADTPLPWRLENVMQVVIERLRAGGISDLTIRNTLVEPKQTLAQIRGKI